MSTTLPSIASQLETDRRDVLAACSGDGSFLMIGENAASPRLQSPRPPLVPLPQKPLFERLGSQRGVVELDSAISLGVSWTVGFWFMYPLPDEREWNTLVQSEDTGTRLVLVQRSNMELGCYWKGKFFGSGLLLKDSSKSFEVSAGWHYLAVIYDVENYGVYLNYFLDGLSGKRGTTIVSSLEDALPIDASSIKFLGNAGDLGQSFGAIKKLTLWNTVFSGKYLDRYARTTAPELLANDKYINDVVAHYQLDGTDDQVSASLGAESRGSLRWAAPSALSVDGVECKIGIALPSTQSGDFTVESWTALPAPAPAPASARLISLGVASEGRVYVKITTAADKSSLSLCAEAKESSRIPLAAGATYVHLAISCGTRAGTSTWTLYVDGVCAGSLQTTDVTPLAKQGLYFACHVPALANLRLWSQVLDAAGVLFRRSLGVIPPSLTGLVGRLVAPDEPEEALPKSVEALAAKTWVTRENWPIAPSLTPSGADATITAGLARRIATTVGYVRQQKQITDAATTRSSLNTAVQLLALNLGGGGIGATLANSEGLPQLDLTGKAQQLTLTLSNNGKLPLWLFPGAEAIRLSFPPGALDTTTPPTTTDFTLTVPSSATGPISLILQSKPNSPATAVNSLVIPISGLKPIGETRICQVAVSCTVADASGKVSKSVRTAQLGMSPPSVANLESRLDGSISEMKMKHDSANTQVKADIEEMKKTHQAAADKVDLDILALSDLLNTKVGELDTKHGELNTKHGELDSKVGDLDTKHRDLDAKHNDLDAKHNALNANHNALNTKHDDLDTRHGELYAKHGELDTKFGDLDTKHGDLDTKHNALNTKHDDLDTKFGAAVAKAVFDLARMEKADADAAAKALSDLARLEQADAAAALNVTTQIAALETRLVAKVFPDEKFSARFLSDARIALSGGIASDLLIEFKGSAIKAIELDLRITEWTPAAGMKYKTEWTPAAGMKDKTGTLTESNIPSTGIISLTQSNVSSVKLTLTGLVSSLTSPSTVRFKAKILAADNKEYVFWLAVECRSYVDKGAKGIVFDETVKTKVIQDSSATPKWKLDTEGTLSANSAVITTDVRFNTLNKNQNAKKLVLDETTLRVEGETVLNGVLSAASARIGSLSERLIRKGVVALDSPITLGNAWTIESWFKYPLPLEAEWNTLALYGDNHHQIIVQRSDMQLGCYFDGFKESGFKLNNTLNNTDSSVVDIELAQGWHHVAAVKTGTNIEFYVDGRFKGKVHCSGVSADKLKNPINWLGNYSKGGQSFGPIKKLSVWGKALTGVEITARAGSNAPVPTGTDILAHYPLDGVSDQVVTSAGSGSPGKVTWFDSSTNDATLLTSGTLSANAVYTGKKTLGQLVPEGTIIMWSGSTTNIPVNWHLCNGDTIQASSGTVKLPNLVGKMIRGRSANPQDPIAGGNDFVTLSPANLPSHTHDVEEGEGHSHDIGMYGGSSSGSGYDTWKIGKTEATTSKAKTGISIKPTGEGKAFSVLPAYYELAFLAYYP